MDETLLLFGQAVSGREPTAETKLTETLAERARGREGRQALLDEILEIVLDPAVDDESANKRLAGVILSVSQSFAGTGRESISRSTGWQVFTKETVESRLRS